MTLIVKHIRGFNTLDSSVWTSISKNKISSVNWNEFPYQPEVTFRTVHNGDMLFIKYDVKERYSVRTVNTQDQDPIYQDSCVEFFILDSEGDYHNFEFNAKGIALSAKGKSKDNRKSRTKNELYEIIRYPSGVEKVGKNYCWSLTIGIPFASLALARGQSYAANFYKCGDLTHTKHYLSWSPINTQRPDFHCPEYFGKIVIE